MSTPRRTTLLLITLACLLTSVLVTKVSAANWYIRPSGTCANNGNGTASTCAASAGAAGAWINGDATTGVLGNVVWASISAGDTIYVGQGGGTYTVGGGSAGKSGSVGNPITFTMQGAGTVTIPGEFGPGGFS